MKQDNKTTREIALEWFTNLPFDESLNLMFKFYPTREDFDKLTYSEKVELIYLSEHPEQAIKEAQPSTLKNPDWREEFEKAAGMTIEEVDNLEWDLYPGNEAGAFDHLDEPDYSPTIKEESQDNSKEGFTSGKWVVNGLEVRNDKGEFVASCMCKYGSVKEDLANAQLIAQAPAMYRFIKEMALRYANSEWIAGEAEAILSRIDNK